MSGGVDPTATAERELGATFDYAHISRTHRRL